MTPEEIDRRYGPEPDEVAQARHDREDRAADHAPRFDLSKPVDWHAVAEYERGRGSDYRNELALQRQAHRNREALAVARDLRREAVAYSHDKPGQRPLTRKLLALADRLDGGQS